MTTDHPITSPNELKQLWAQQAQRLDPRDPVAWLQYVADKAARWGSDQELEACCEWLTTTAMSKPWETVAQLANELRNHRRPKPPSLKEQALETLRQIPINPEAGVRFSDLDIIRRALEAQR